MGLIDIGLARIHDERETMKQSLDRHFAPATFDFNRQDLAEDGWTIVCTLDGREGVVTVPFAAMRAHPSGSTYGAIAQGARLAWLYAGGAPRVPFRIGRKLPGYLRQAPR